VRVGRETFVSVGLGVEVETGGAVWVSGCVSAAGVMVIVDSGHTVGGAFAGGLVIAVFRGMQDDNVSVIVNRLM